MAYILIPLPCRSFSTEQYFDSHGFFITIILGFPVMFNMTLLIVRDGDIYIYIYNPYTCMRYNVRIIYIYIYIYIYILYLFQILLFRWSMTLLVATKRAQLRNKVKKGGIEEKPQEGSYIPAADSSQQDLKKSQ